MENNYTKLIQISNRLTGSIETSFLRTIYNSIDFNARLIVLKGFRGVGKTTILLQHLNLTSNTKKSIFLSLDNLIFTEINLSDAVEYYYNQGFRTFALDEVHKYPTWSIEVKNIYDSYPDIHLIITASSILKTLSGAADLSRRADTYNVYGLSFREYLIMDKKIRIPCYTFDELIDHHTEIAEEYNQNKILSKAFKQYIKLGYYPFFIESKSQYYQKLEQIIHQVIEIDLPAIFDIDYRTIRQIKKLLSIIARIAPFAPNVSNLARDLSIGRERVLLLLDYLDRARLINQLKSAAKSDSAMTKPDKIFLENTNLVHAIGNPDANIGTERETFAMNALKVNNKVSFPVKGDFMINGKFILEVGGKNKTFHQIMDMPNPILIKDGIDIGHSNIIPLWILGLNY